MLDAQLQLLAAGIMAETDPVLVGWRDVRNDVFLTEWVNTETTTDAWHSHCDKRELFEATDVTLFDNLTAGKRALWQLMMDNAPIDMTRAKMRKAIIDTWGTTNSKAVLEGCLHKATRAELYLGYTTVATANPVVSALKLNFQGTVSIHEVSEAMNRFAV
jgi:hypothetical protein